MLGGGVFVTQNKTLPGSYINVVNASSATSAIGERGVVALVMVADGLSSVKGKVIEITASDFATKCKEILDADKDLGPLQPLREIFCHANKVYLYAYLEEGVEGALSALEAYEFNTIYTPENSDQTKLITQVKSWRDDMGKKCQAVVDNVEGGNHEGIINVVSEATGGVYNNKLGAWVAGAMAGCKVNESCTNMLYDGELTVVTDKSQSELEQCIKNGEVAFHLVYGEVRLLEDINSLTTTTADKGEDFKYNQTIRVTDQIANDIAKLFNTKYLGKIPNNASGRVSLWADIVAHHREMESIQAIENFDATLLTVEQGNTKKSVVVNDVITVTNAMAQLYMTVVVQ